MVRKTDLLAFFSSARHILTVAQHSVVNDMPPKTAPLGLLKDIRATIDKLEDTSPQHELLRFIAPFRDSEAILEEPLDSEFRERFIKDPDASGEDVMVEYLASLEDALEELTADSVRDEVEKEISVLT